MKHQPRTNTGDAEEKASGPTLAILFGYIAGPGAFAGGVIAVR